MDRRTFLSAGALALAASNGATGEDRLGKRVEYKVHEHDIVVAGGGPAGCAATLAARRLGADVAVIEQHPCFGGVWTMGTLAIIIDSQNKTGLMRAITTQLRKDRHLHDGDRIRARQHLDEALSGSVPVPASEGLPESAHRGPVYLRVIPGTRQLPRDGRFRSHR